MNKEEFTDFLKRKAEERSGSTHWAKTATNTDDYWHLYKPGVDWLEDDMDLKEDGVVKIMYDKTLGIGDDTSQEFKTTYDDFVSNYDKTVRR